MRWPIRFQLLLPTLTVVVLAIALASGVSAYFDGMRARQNQEENLRRVVATLAEAQFPLNESVLQQMRGLSGADFVLFDRSESLQVSTLRLTDRELIALLAIPSDQRAARLSTSPTVSIRGRIFLGQRVGMTPHDPIAPAGSLVVLYPQDRWWAAALQAAYPAILAGAVAVAAVVLVSTWLAYRFVQPIHDLQRHAAKIAQGDFQPAATARRNDEIRDLTLSINQMAEQLGQFESQVRRHEQLRTLGQLGAGMAHQLRNAATGGRMAIELHQRECAGNCDGESLDVALRQLRLMESYLQRFLAVGRTGPITLTPLSLTSVLASAVALVRPTCAHAHVELIYHEPASPFWVRGDSDALRQLILNLVLNAIEAISGATVHTVWGTPSASDSDSPIVQTAVNDNIASDSAASQETPSPRPVTKSAPVPDPRLPPPRITLEIEPLGSGRVAVHVSDTGPGLPADVVDRLFEPFVTSKSEGTGLGLYVARQIAEFHQGSLHWQRIREETRFSLTLPLIPNPQSPIPNP
jgi:signal transduction histidine kinase